MPAIELQLRKLPDNTSTVFNNIKILRRGQSFIIDRKEYTISEALTKMGQIPGLYYNQLVFLSIVPPAEVISIHTVKNKDEHKQLLQQTAAKGRLLYYADVIERDGKKYASSPWTLDWDSVPQQKIAPVSTKQETMSGDLVCPFCKKIASSTSGLTLHIKAKHKQ